MQELVDRYPKSEYVADAKNKIQVASDQLAGKEMEVGRFYLQKRNYTGAINRFRDVVAQVPDHAPRRGGAERLTEAYMALGIVDEAQTAAAVLGPQLPRQPLVQGRLRAADQGRRRAARGRRQSWISKAFRGVTRTVGQRTG